jgi:hypothetical protein
MPPAEQRVAGGPDMLYEESPMGGHSPLASGRITKEQARAEAGAVVKGMASAMAAGENSHSYSNLPDAFPKGNGPDKVGHAAERPGSRPNSRPGSRPSSRGGTARLPAIKTASPLIAADAGDGKQGDKQPENISPGSSPKPAPLPDADSQVGNAAQENSAESADGSRLVEASSGQDKEGENENGKESFPEASENEKENVDKANEESAKADSEDMSSAPIEKKIDKGPQDTASEHGSATTVSATPELSAE